MLVNKNNEIIDDINIQINEDKTIKSYSEQEKLINTPSNEENFKNISLDSIIIKLHPLSTERTNNFSEKTDIAILNPQISDKKLLTEEEIKYLCEKSLEIFMEEPVLLEITSPINICGDTHGQFNDLLRLFEFGGRIPKSNYLFLGDYVDRGKNSIENICLLLAYKIKYPKNIFLLRGNHESELINHVYGFFDECKRRYDIKIHKLFSTCFNWLPVAAIINDTILCMHGGLSPFLKSLNDIKKIIRPTEIPDKGILCDILWSDPDINAYGWDPSPRGISYVYNQNIAKEIIENLNIDLVCRAHQVVEEGYEFFANKKLVTVFSAPNYCGQFDNAGAMMKIDENLVCGFKIIVPKLKNKFIDKEVYKDMVRKHTPPTNLRNVKDEGIGDSI